MDIYQASKWWVKYPPLVYTKTINIRFRALWLATQARDILHYPLVCKTQWTRARVITFQPSFKQIKFIFYRWLFTGLVYTSTIIRLRVGEYGGYLPSLEISTAIHRHWRDVSLRQKTLLTGLVYTNTNYSELSEYGVKQSLITTPVQQQQQQQQQFCIKSRIHSPTGGNIRKLI